MATDRVSASPVVRRPLRALWVILLVAAAVGLVTAGFMILGALVGEGFGYFSKEPAETFRVPRYIGWQAYTIWLIEAGGASAALFSGWVVHRHRGPGRESSFLLAAGAFSVILLTDDMFQFHDYVYVRLFRLDERIVYLAYALMAVGLAWRWGRHVARQDSSLVLLAGAWLALSIGIDQIADKAWIYFHVVEDGGKMMGLTLWVTYLIRTGMRMVSDCIDAPRAARADRDDQLIPVLRDDQLVPALMDAPTLRLPAVEPAGTPAPPDERQAVHASAAQS